MSSDSEKKSSEVNMLEIAAVSTAVTVSAIVFAPVTAVLATGAGVGWIAARVFPKIFQDDRSDTKK